MTSTSPPPPGPSLAPHPPGVQVLIPQHIPGPIYYPPCKCDMMNQVSVRNYIYSAWTSSQFMEFEYHQVTLHYSFYVHISEINVLLLIRTNSWLKMWHLRRSMLQKYFNIKLFASSDSAYIIQYLCEEALLNAYANWLWWKNLARQKTFTLFF